MIPDIDGLSASLGPFREKLVSLNRQLTHPRPDQRPSTHSPCLSVSAGNRGHLGDCLVRGQDCQLGQEGLVDQGAPSLQEAREALVVPRDLQ